MSFKDLFRDEMGFLFESVLDIRQYFLLSASISGHPPVFPAIHN